ncbi:MAG: TIGR01906 family membrane protein [Dehalococcoidia bacterium]|nr:TIGR01906 family membrane protein [Dehalococcoidia bacterium]|tara:strand:+ start:251 stop:928 length:678 start_codon:yes stop_codon:yes gene_type:complete
MKVVVLIFKGLFVISVPILLIIIASDVVIKTSFIYEYDYWKYNITERTNIDLNNLREIGRDIRDYFENDQEYLSIETTVNNQKKYLFNQREVEHMKDVKNLINFLDFIGLILGSILIVFSCLLFFYDKYWKKTLVNLIFSSGLFSIFLIISILLIFLAFFDYFFILFHEISFSNDLWILNPKTDYLIMIFPEKFFRDASYLIGLISILEFLFFYLIIRYLFRFKG